jgi:uncharacterized protein YegL
MKIAAIIDATGSMLGATLQTIDGVNEYINGLKADETTREADLTLTVFNSEIGVKFIHNDLPVKDVPKFTQKDYKCDGVTPLYDAIGTTIHSIAHRATTQEKILFIILTDGLNNASREYDFHTIHKLIKEKEKEGNWTFVFLGADIDAWAAQQSMNLGMATANTMSYGKHDTRNTMRGLAGQTVSYAGMSNTSTDDFFGKQGKNGDTDEGVGGTKNQT